MIYFCDFIAKGFSKNKVFRQAKLTMRQTENDEELIYNDPFI
jgi:hypothetical protein